MIDFYSGQKVVCINAGDNLRDYWLQPYSRYRSGSPNLVEGGIYTIQWVGPWGLPGWYAEHICVTLYEDTGNRRAWIDKPDSPLIPYDARRFKPLIEKKTDISQLMEILNKTNKTTELEKEGIYSV